MTRNPQNNPRPTPEPNLSVKDVVTWLGVTGQTAKHLPYQGENFRYVVAGMYSFADEDVRDYLATYRYDDHELEAATRPHHPKQKKLSSFNSQRRTEHAP